MQVLHGMKAPDDRVRGVMVVETEKSLWFAFVSTQPPDCRARTLEVPGAAATVPSAHTALLEP